MTSKSETFRTYGLVQSANSIVLSDHEHEKSEHYHDKELREIASNAKNRQTGDFSRFSQIL